MVLALWAMMLHAQPERRQRQSDFTTEGKEFWLVFQKNFRDWVTDEKTQRQRPADALTLELFITSSQNATGYIEIKGLRFRQDFSVPAGQVITIPIDTAAQLRSSEVVEELGVHVVADQPIAVYGLNRRYQTTDTYLAHPVNVLGKRYRAVGYRWLQNDLLSQVAIIATEDNTEITITPTASTSGPMPAGAKSDPGRSRPMNKPFTIELDRGEVYQVIPKYDPRTMSDLTGTLVEADKPIAVFSGHNCAYVPDNATKACNLLVEQLPAINAWGRQFFVGALAGRSSSVIRIVASEDNTQVFENNRLVATLNAGEYFQDLSQTQHTMVTSSHPVLVTQYSKGFDNGDNVGDPMMIVVAPTEQFLSSYRFATPVRGSWRHYINLIVPTSTIDSLRLDGRAVDRSSFQVFGISLYSIAQIEVSYGTHVITNSQPFGLYSYGFGYDEAAYDAYGNGGGQSLEQVIQYPDTMEPTLSAAFGRIPGDRRGAINAIARDDQVNDRGLDQIVVLDNEVLDVQIPKFESGTPQVSIILRPNMDRMNGYAQFRLRDRAGNVSYHTVCAHYDAQRDTLLISVQRGLEPCDFSSGRQWGGYLGYAVLDNHVTIPANSPELNNSVELKGNPGVPTWSMGGYVEQPWTSSFVLRGIVSLTFLKADARGYDSTLNTASDGTRISEEFRLHRTAVQFSVSPGIHYFLARRNAYLFGHLTIGVPLFTSEVLTRTIISPANYVYESGLGERVDYDDSGPSGIAIALTPEIGIGATADLPNGWHIFGELGTAGSLTSISPDRDWTISYLFARAGVKVRW